MEITFRRAIAHGVEPVADLLTAAYEGYVIPLHISAESLLHMVRVDSVDLTASLVMCLHDQPAGVGLVARRGWTSRVAAFALRPAFRGQGHGAALLARLVEEARERGERRMVLEVIEGNAAAEQLYARGGFQPGSRLVGFGGVVEPDASAEISAVDLREVSAAVARYAEAELPWQISAETLALLAPPVLAFAGRRAWIAVRPLGTDALSLCALVSEPGPERAAGAVDLLRAVAARFPARRWRVPALWPEAAAEVLEQAGLERIDLTQRLMHRSLAAEF